MSRPGNFAHVQIIFYPTIPSIIDFLPSGNCGVGCLSVPPPLLAPEIGKKIEDQNGGTTKERIVTQQLIHLIIKSFKNETTIETLDFSFFENQTMGQ